MHTLVVFVDVSVPPRTNRMHKSVENYLPLFGGGGWPLPVGIKKVVVNIRYTEEIRVPSFPCDVAGGCETLEKAVLIFEPFIPVAPMRSSGPRANALFKLVNGLSHKGVDTDLVGLEAALPDVLDKKMAPLWQQQADGLGRVQTLKREGYAATVGAKQFRLETVE